jgi:hypothetical protein
VWLVPGTEVWQFLNKLNIESPCDLQFHSVVYTQEDENSQTKPVHSIYFSSIHNSQKCPRMDEWALTGWPSTHGSITQP